MCDDQSWKKRDGSQRGKCDESPWGDSRGSSWDRSGEQGDSGSSNNMPDTWWRGHAAGHAVGFTAGFRSGFEEGTKSFKRGRPEPTTETDRSSLGASAKKKSKKASQKGDGWKNWRETFTPFDEDEATEDYYYTRTGSKSTTIAIYPAEIQEKLRKAAVWTPGWESRDIEYDMTDGWVYNIRLFSEEEQKDWGEQLARIMTEEDGELVGAQWNSTKAVLDPGPGCFEETVKYRPVFLKNPKEVVA